MIPLLLSFTLSIDTLSYMYAVPSIDKDTMYIHNGEMCEAFIRVWELTDPTQEIEIVEDIIPYRRKYINSLETASTYQYN